MKDFNYDFEKAYDYLINNANEYGVEVAEGTGQFLKEGKPFDFVEEVHKTFSAKIADQY